MLHDVWLRVVVLGCAVACSSGEGGGGGGVDSGAGAGAGGFGAFGGASGASGAGGSAALGGSAGSSGAAGSAGAAGCAPELMACAGECVDVSGHPLHCGGCAVACATGEVCDGGQCQKIDDCTSTPCVGFAYCDLASKQCLPGCALHSDCGANAQCDGQHACNCVAGYHDCGGNCVANSAVSSCGSACTPCPAPANGQATCSAGQCGAKCNSGYHLCNGACVASSSPAHCGSSCSPCPTVPNGQATCTGGACGLSCSAGHQLCKGACIPNTQACDPLASERKSCIDEINLLRSKVGAKALTQKASANDCADNQASLLSQSFPSLAGGFGLCGESAALPCLSSSAKSCITQLSPGSGSYIVATGSQYSQAACGFYKSGSSYYIVVDFF